MTMKKAEFVKGRNDLDRSRQQYVENCLKSYIANCGSMQQHCS